MQLYSKEIIETCIWEEQILWNWSSKGFQLEELQKKNQIWSIDQANAHLRIFAAASCDHLLNLKLLARKQAFMFRNNLSNGNYAHSSNGMLYNSSAMDKNRAYKIARYTKIGGM